MHTSTSEFGKDHGLIHEAVVTGRKVGAGAIFWSRLAHDKKLFRRVVKEVVQMMVVATRPFDPVKFIGEKWSIIAKECDERSAALTEADFSGGVAFETCLKEKEGETFITGEEKLIRLKASGKIRLGTSVFAGLWADYQTRKENSVLERLYGEQGTTYLDFFGDVLLGPDGCRDVLYLYRGGDGGWDWDCRWLESGWDAYRRSASLAS